MQISYFAVFVATILDFVAGFIWFGPIFGKMWGKIHGFDKLSKDVQVKMMKQMGPWYGVQLAVTLLTNFILAIFISYVPNWNAYALAGFLWLGLVVPTYASANIFGGTDPKWLAKKFMIQVGGSLIFLEIAAVVIHFFG